MKDPRRPTMPGLFERLDLAHIRQAAKFPAEMV